MREAGFYLTNNSSLVIFVSLYTMKGNRVKQISQDSSLLPTISGISLDTIGLCKIVHLKISWFTKFSPPTQV